MGEPVTCRPGDLREEMDRIRSALAAGFAVAHMVCLYSCRRETIEAIRDAHPTLPCRSPSRRTRRSRAGSHGLPQAGAAPSSIGGAHAPEGVPLRGPGRGDGREARRIAALARCSSGARILVPST